MGKKLDQLKAHVRGQLDLILFRLQHCNYPGRWVGKTDLEWWYTRSCAYVECIRTVSSAAWIRTTQRAIALAYRDAHDRLSEHQREMSEYEEDLAAKAEN